jgi:hypothetical protein
LGKKFKRSRFNHALTSVLIEPSPKSSQILTSFEQSSPSLSVSSIQHLIKSWLLVPSASTFWRESSTTSRQRAATNKFQNFIHQPSDLYKLETSFIQCPEEQTVILILHVLFVEAENLLPLYEFISLPIYFNFSSMFPPFRMSKNQISLELAILIQTLSTSDLANCKRLGQTFFCEGQSVLQTNIVQDCLGSLYLRSATLIKANCKFRIDSTREKICTLGNNTLVVDLIGTIATNQVCPKAGTLSPLKSNLDSRSR